MDVNKLMLSRIFDTTERLDTPLFQSAYGNRPLLFALHLFH